MAFSPLQSRLVASLVASLLVLALYLLLFSPHLALAEELSLQSGLNGLRGPPLEDHSLLEPPYQPDFAPFDRSIIGRAPPGITLLNNNIPSILNLEPGSVACYAVQKSVIFSKNNTQGRIIENKELDVIGDLEFIEGQSVRRQEVESRTVFLSANACLQPHQADPESEDRVAPQLTLLASTSSEVGCPRSKNDLGEEFWQDFEEGIAMLSMESADDLYVSIMAPSVSKGFEGVYNFELVASIDDYYHSFHVNQDGLSELLWMDSDSSAALLTTKNLTDSTRNSTTDEKESQKYVADHDPPFKLYVENGQFKVFDGIRRSVCAMKSLALIEANKDGDGRSNGLVSTELTTRGPGGLPKQQFYFEGLNESSIYNAILVKTASTAKYLSERQEEGSEKGLVGGGGTVYGGIEFRTGRGTSCKVVTDLDFCSDVQYAVPGSDRFNGTELAKIYDDYAKQMYSNFEKVMMQIPCETDPTSRYSLARGCDDCRNAYKRWLCTVAIPRCEDYTSDNFFTIIRNAGQPFPNGTLVPDEERQQLMQKTFHNSSRNRFIDEAIKPGPYREILPCEDICYEVVQSCPAAIGFSCPRPGWPGFNASYGERVLERQQLADPNMVVCNYPGEPRTRMSTGNTVFPPGMLLVISLAALWAISR